MNLIIIACIDNNYALGKDNKLLYRIKEDLKFFKETTTNHYIVMGKNTFYSLNGLLPNRKHLVISTTMSNIENVRIFRSIEEFLNSDIKEDVFVIGGEQIYRELIKYASVMYLTHVDSTKEADAFFPRFNKEEWNALLMGNYSDENYSYKRICYTKKGK